MTKRVANKQAKGKGLAKRAEPVAESEAHAEPKQESHAEPAGKVRDPRLPAVGAVLTKERGRQTHEVKVLAEGFEYRGETYRSLSKIARLITGVSWNGFAFFGLGRGNAEDAQ